MDYENEVKVNESVATNEIKPSEDLPTSFPDTSFAGSSPVESATTTPLAQGGNLSADRIVGDLTSGNYANGVAGWKISYGGDIEANSGNFRGDITGASGTFTGTITATTGAIGGWTIGATSITDTAGATGLSSAITAGDDIRFWAGHATPTSAPFRVTEAGALTATSATISGAVTITSGSGIANLTDAGNLATADTADFSTQVSGAEKPANNATVGATWGTNLSGIPAMLGAPSGAGLYLSSTYLGYYDSAAWKSYIDSSGNFYFKGDDDSSIDWNISTASTLTIKGKVIAGTGSSIGTGYLSGLVGLSNTNISAQGWTNTCVFSATDYRVVAWATGVITTAAGTAYNITGANTGNMAATTYIYLDIAVSTTLLQTTTTAATAIGSGKILVATAVNNSDTTSKAQYQVFGGVGGVRLFVDNISANSASTNEFISNSAQLANLVVTDAKIGSLAVSKLTAGSITSKAITLAIAAGTGDSYIAGGNNIDMANWRGGDGSGGAVILGLDDSDSDKGKFFAGNYSTGQFAQFDGVNFIVNNSPVTNQNIFGDGSDGDATIAVDTTLTTDKYYDDLTVNNGVTLNSGHYRIFVKGTLTNNGTISRNGNAGTAGDNGTGYGQGGVGNTGAGAGGAGGTALAAGFFNAGEDGKAGTNGGDGVTSATSDASSNATDGDAVSYAMGVSGVIGAVGGQGGDAGATAGGLGGNAGAAGVATTPTIKIRVSSELVSFRDFTQATPAKLNNSAGTGGSSGGGGGAGTNTGARSGGGGGGGGAGSSGGTLLICARTITNAGTISATGGNGGNGGTGGNGYDGGSGMTSGGGGGGAGGSGGSGGVVILMYSTLTNSGTISAAGGTAGTGGAGGLKYYVSGSPVPEDGDTGSNGTAGGTGTTIQLQI